MAFSPQTLRRIRPSVSGNMRMQRCNENCPASETTNRTGSNCCLLVPTPPQASACATHNSLGPDLFCDRGVVRRTTQRFWMDLRNLCAGCAAKLKAEINESKGWLRENPKNPVHFYRTKSNYLGTRMILTLPVNAGFSALSCRVTQLWILLAPIFFHRDVFRFQ